MNIRSALGSSLIKDTFKLSSSNVLMYLLPVIVTPVLSRLYEPTAFGDWGIFSSVLTIVGVVLFLGYENAVVKAKETSDALNLSALCGILSLVIIALIYAVFTICKRLGINFFTTFPSINLLTICLLGYALYNIMYNLANRFERYTSMSIAGVVQGGSQALFRILFATVFVIPLNGLIFGTTIAQIVSALFLVVCLYYKLIGNNLHIISLSKMKEQMSLNRHFPLYDAPASLLSFAAFNLPIIILSFYYSKSEIGCYSILIQLLLMPMSFVGSAMGRVYYRQISGTQELVEQKRITLKVLKISSVISVLPMLFIALGGDYVIVLFLGEKWTNVGNMAVCLSLWSFLTILTQPMISLLRLKDRLSWLLICDICYFVFGISSIFITNYFCRNLLLTITIYSMSCCLAKFVLFKIIMKTADLRICLLGRQIMLLWIIALAVVIIRLIGLFVC